MAKDKWLVIRSEHGGWWVFPPAGGGDHRRFSTFAEVQRAFNAPSLGTVYGLVDAARDMERALAEQRICRDYIAEHGYDRGAALGLADNLMEEVILLEQEKRCTSGS